MSAETLRRAASLMREEHDPRWLGVADWLDVTASAADTYARTPAALTAACAYLKGDQ